ncbi:MAG: hypothetical protein ACP5OG_00520 [Candidatus Nanoarchaeia archaeon]
MVNEDILTGLRNAIERGDNLENASRVMINSGYNQREVEEASRFIGSGVLTMQAMKNDEHLAMPNKKSFFGLFSNKAKKPQNPVPVNKSPAPVSHPYKVETTLPKQAPASNPQPQGQYQRQGQINPNATPNMQSNNPPRISPTTQPSQNPFQPQTIQQQKQPEAPKPNIQNNPNLQARENYSLQPFTSNASSQMQANQQEQQKESYLKEIILSIILLVLIALLAGTIIFRNKLAEIFSSLFG